MAGDAFLGSTTRIPCGESWAHLIEIPSLEFFVTTSSGNSFHRELMLPTVRIGAADDNDLVIKDPTVSRHHALIRRTPLGLLVKDLISKNGVFIRGVRTVESYIESGVEIQLGHVRIRTEPVSGKMRAEPRDRAQLGDLIGQSRVMQEIYSLIEAVAPTPATVLVTGESGTGKEEVARALHTISGRSGPLAIYDCANATPEMIRSELFGHQKGAFTGAQSERLGAFRSAQRGTLFLDEIGEIPVSLQPSLLRVLESREVVPVGRDVPVPVDVRLVAATNRRLEDEVREGHFREDLYHRLSVIEIKMPPLRDRLEDVPSLVDHFIRTLGLEIHFLPEAIAKLGAGSWPGNVRALRNAVERAAILAGGGPVPPEHIVLPTGSMAALVPSKDVTGESSIRPLQELEREAILAAYHHLGRNQVHTAQALGIGVSTLRRRLAEYREQGFDVQGPED